MALERVRRRMGPAGSLAIAAAYLMAAGCEDALPSGPPVCTAIAVEGLNVTVTDAATGQRLCDGTVTVREGGFSAELRRFGGPFDCVHTGPTERAGRYEVQVTRARYATVTRADVVVTADECHVIPVMLTIPLDRAQP